MCDGLRFGFRGPRRSKPGFFREAPLKRGGLRNVKRETAIALRFLAGCLNICKQLIVFRFHFLISVEMG